MFRPQPISSTDARKYFTKIINKVQFSSKSFVIKSYRQPIVRVVNENYIRALEEVIGKKTVNQVMQIAGNDRLFEAEKIEQIKKVFQRRLSGSLPARPKPQPRPQPQQPQKSRLIRPQVQPKPQPTKPQPRPQPRKPQKPATPTATSTLNPKPQPQQKQVPKPQPPVQKKQKTKRVLLLSNGKNYA